MNLEGPRRLGLVIAFVVAGVVTYKAVEYTNTYHNVRNELATIAFANEQIEWNKKAFLNKRKYAITKSKDLQKKIGSGQVEINESMLGTLSAGDSASMRQKPMPKFEFQKKQIAEARKGIVKSLGWMILVWCATFFLIYGIIKYIAKGFTVGTIRIKK